MDLGLSGQVAFVAGSSRGIGRAIAASFLEEGCRVVLTGRDAASVEKTRSELEVGCAGGSLMHYCGDFTDAPTIKRAFAEVIQRWGQVDFLIANLGTGSGKPGWEQDEAEWQRLFNANFFGSIRLAEAAIPHLQESNAAAILFIASITGIEATPAPLPYCAAKAALLNYSKNLARALAPGIRVNAIAPGNIFFAGGSWERHLANREEAVRQMLATEVPVRRFGTPREIADLAVYLCSSRSAFTTGSCFVSDGGQSRVI